MNKEEAKQVLEAELNIYRGMSFAQLTANLGNQGCWEATAASGAVYQIEIDVHWDGKDNSNLRVIGSIDNGGLSALMPLTSSFVMTPEGGLL